MEVGWPLGLSGSAVFFKLNICMCIISHFTLEVPLSNHGHSQQHTFFSISFFRFFSLSFSLALLRLKAIFAHFNVSVWKCSEQLQFNLRQLINRQPCVLFVSSMFVCWVWFRCCLKWWKILVKLFSCKTAWNRLCRCSKDQCAHFRSDYTCIHLVCDDIVVHLPMLLVCVLCKCVPSASRRTQLESYAKFI